MHARVETPEWGGVALASFFFPVQAGLVPDRHVKSFGGKKWVPSRLFRLSSSELLRQPESEARLECVLTDPEVRAPRHAPPLPRAAPGRPLQGLTSWPTPWTVQQAACGSLARATSAVEHAFALSGAARRAAPGSGRGCPLHRRGSRVTPRGRPWVCAAAADVYERRSTRR